MSNLPSDEMTAHSGRAVGLLDMSPLLRHLLWLQFETNCLSSVAIEYPALRRHPLLAEKNTISPPRPAHD